MKALIELDNDMFKDIRESDFEVSRKIVRDFQATISDSIRNGTPIPDNATNGDIIKAMFPNVETVRQEISSTSNNIVVRDDSFFGAINRFHADWWNAPYKTNERD